MRRDDCGDLIYKRKAHTAVVYDHAMFVFGVCPALALSLPRAFHGDTHCRWLPAGKMAPFLRLACTVPTRFIKILCTAPPLLPPTVVSITDVSGDVHMVFEIVQYSLALNPRPQPCCFVSEAGPCESPFPLHAVHNVGTVLQNCCIVPAPFGPVPVLLLVAA